MKLSIQDAAAQIRGMDNQGEIQSALGPYTKAEIKAIAVAAGVQLPGGCKKEQWVLLLAKQFGYKGVDKAIHNRSR